MKLVAVSFLIKVEDLKKEEFEKLELWMVIIINRLAKKGDKATIVLVLNF